MSFHRLDEDLALVTHPVAAAEVAGWCVADVSYLPVDRNPIKGVLCRAIRDMGAGRKVAFCTPLPSDRAVGVVAALRYALRRGSSVRGIAAWVVANGYHAPVWSDFVSECEFAAEELTEVRLRPGVLGAPPGDGAGERTRDGMLAVTVPPGIGDSLWAMVKVPALLEAHDAAGCDVRVSVGSRPNSVERRAVPFLRRLDFVNSVTLVEEGGVLEAAAPNDARGRYNYLPSEWYRAEDGRTCLRMIPNGHLERGGRLESWLPDLDPDWRVMDRCLYTAGELRAARIMAEDPYAVLYLGPGSGNTTSGHNRGWLWSPHDWFLLADHLNSRGVRLLVVGAEYDMSFWRHVLPAMRPLGGAVECRIGLDGIGQTVAILKHAQLVVSYQSGIGISAVMMGVPTAMWWRPDGDSCDPARLVSFSEAMRYAWAPPGAAFEEGGTYLGGVYGKTMIKEVKEWADKILS